MLLTQVKSMLCPKKGKWHSAIRVKIALELSCSLLSSYTGYYSGALLLTFLVSGGIDSAIFLVNMWSGNEGANSTSIATGGLLTCKKLILTQKHAMVNIIPRAVCKWLGPEGHSNSLKCVNMFFTVGRSRGHALKPNIYNDRHFR